MPQSLSKVYLHLIFSTKRRELNIVTRLKEEMFSNIAQTLNRLGCTAIVVGGTENHIHALFCMSKTKSISDIVRDVKSYSAKWFKQRLGCNFEWQDGYGIFSVSQTKVEAVRKYIVHQEEHHKRHTFQDEFRNFLNNYGLSYDERYVWD